MTELSICIPTCNRAEYLPVMLDSIFKQAVFDGVEVVVSDNNSYDDTARVVKEYQALYKNLFYYKNDINVGFDRNVLNCISRAKGKYCWILGDDDALLPGSIGFVKHHIKSGYDFYTCGLNLCDRKMRFLDYWALTRGVKDGKIVLPRPMNCVHAGLTYEAELETLPAAFERADGTAQDRKRRLVSVTVKMLDSRGGKVGTDAQRMDEIAGFETRHLCHHLQQQGI